MSKRMVVREMEGFKTAEEIPRDSFGFIFEFLKELPEPLSLNMVNGEVRALWEPYRNDFKMLVIRENKTLTLWNYRDGSKVELSWSGRGQVLGLLKKKIALSKSKN